ncbi:hypothetical protein [Acidithiobacillus sp.]|jgi:hypothetical protein|uniref:hypothetical protein n=1 Tax=Acidithiobacillus sp. TaxID=1872118 RepID=UPI001CDCA4FB|nr:hypothetical protein [Acidithiobacillus sp.]MDA8246935.1 hypothetical protein [Acidithiobacillus sp.]UBU63716.1 hypothetical protein LDB30_06890 [Acidithiobacillus ferrooxidans]
MDISAVGQSVEAVRKILEKAVAPGIDELRVDMKDVQSRMDRLETAVARLDVRMDSVNSNLAAISTSLAQLAAAIAISSTARYGGNDDKRSAVG